MQFHTKLVVSKYYSKLFCWTCRDPSHFSFPCRHLHRRGRVYLRTDTIRVKSSHSSMFVHSDKVNVEIAASLHLIFNCSVCLLELIVLITGGTKLTTPRRPPNSLQEIFLLKVKLESNLSFETRDYLYS